MLGRCREIPPTVFIVNLYFGEELKLFREDLPWRVKR